jgi:integrase
MTTLRLAFVDRFKDRHGKIRHYYRREGRRIALPGRPGEADFMDAYAAASAEFDTNMLAPISRYAPGTVDALAAAYFASVEFKSLSDETKRTYRFTIERFCDEHGSSRVAHLQRKHVKAIVATRYEASGAAAANKLLKNMRLLMKLAIELGWRKDDPTLGLKLAKLEGDGFADWSEADIAKFEKRWSSGSRQRLAMYLALYTGQRRSDIVRMGRQHMRGESIEVRQQKTGARLLLPIHPKLKAELAHADTKHLTFIVTEYGAPFSVAGFGGWFSDAAREAGLVDRSLHGLRKSAARRLAEAGCSTKQIAAVTGHASLREVERYTLAAEQETLARDAMDKLAR